MGNGTAIVTRNGNDRPYIRERYIVKTVGNTGNGDWYDQKGGKEGDLREKHNENTIGEFKHNNVWYTVYWRCQELYHGRHCPIYHRFQSSADERLWGSVVGSSPIPVSAH